MKARFFALACVLLSFPAICSAEENSVRVAFILPLTGDAASVGEAIKNGALLAHSHLSAGQQKRLSLIFEDDGLQAAKAVTALNRLLPQVSAIVNYSSGTAKALSSIVEAHKVPLIAFASDPEVVAGKNYVVNLWVTPEAEVSELIPQIKKKAYRRIARITSIHAWSYTMKRAYDKRPEESGAEIVLDEEQELTDKDFHPYLTKLRRQKNVDAVFAILNHGHIGIFAKQARASGIELPVFGFEMFEDSNEVAVSEGALIGQWYVNGDDPPAGFLTEYKTRYPGASLYAAANGHDALLLLAQASERSTDTQSLNAFLHDVRNFTGALGTYSSTGDNRFSLPAAVKVVTDHGFERIED